MTKIAETSRALAVTTSYAANYVQNATNVVGAANQQLDAFAAPSPVQEDAATLGVGATAHRYGSFALNNPVTRTLSNMAYAVVGHGKRRDQHFLPRAGEAQPETLAQARWVDPLQHGLVGAVVTAWMEIGAACAGAAGVLVGLTAGALADAGHRLVHSADVPSPKYREKWAHVITATSAAVATAYMAVGAVPTPWAIINMPWVPLQAARAAVVFCRGAVFATGALLGAAVGLTQAAGRSVGAALQTRHERAAAAVAQQQATPPPEPDTALIGPPEPTSGPAGRTDGANDADMPSSSPGSVNDEATPDEQDKNHGI